MSAKDWPSARLGDVLTLNYGWSLPEKRRVPGPFPVYGSSGVVGWHDSALVHGAGIVVGRKGSVGKVHFSNAPFCPIDTTFYVDGGSTSLNLRFASYLLRYVDLSRLTSDVGVPGLNREAAYGMVVSLPNDLHEQSAIAMALGAVEAAIEQQEQLLALTRQLKATLLAMLFPERACKERFVGSQWTGSPAKWPVVSLGEIAAVRGGKRLPKGEPFSPGPTRFPYVRVTDFADDSVDITNLKFLRAETQAAISRYTISSRDVFISIAGSIGIVGMVPEELDGANLTENAAKLELRGDRVLARYLMYYLSSPRAQAEIRAQTLKNAQPKLALARIAALGVPQPTRAEQQAAVDLLDGVSAKIRLCSRKARVLSALFRTLLHQLMTAQLRVQDLDLSALDATATAA